MKYISTRNSSNEKNFQQIVMEGLPPDGGLFIPTYCPKVDVRNFKGIEYSELAFEIIFPYCGDSISREELRIILVNTYKKFHHPKTAPLINISEKKYILELFYGPTFAFKDYALQFLGDLFEYFLNKEQNNITILGATSGDTGSAAIEAFKMKNNINIFIFHPHEKISDVQRRQMTTVNESNVHNIAIKGNFDDCQNIVKNLFVDKELLSNTNVASINSINWARIISQTVYYYWAFLQLDNADKVNFIVPSGNFGNIYAAHVANKMGLPIEKLYLVTNANDILHRIISRGEMVIKEVQKTYSPSMDIQISSNFERQLFEILNHDNAKLTSVMKAFVEEGRYNLDNDTIKKLQNIYSTHSVSDPEILQTIKLYSKKYKYTADPHTATGLKILEEIEDFKNDSISIACAHPSKFSQAIKKATGNEVEYPDSLGKIFDKNEKFTILNNNINDIKEFILNKL